MLSFDLEEIEEFVSDESVGSSKSLSEEFVEIFIKLESFLYGSIASVRSRKAKSKIKNCERYILQFDFSHYYCHRLWKTRGMMKMINEDACKILPHILPKKPSCHT